MEQKANDAAKIKYNQLGVILKREEVSQIVLSILMAVTEETVSKWVKNKQQPTSADMYRIAQLLKVNFQELYVETRWEEGLSVARALQIERTKANNKNNPPKFKGSK